MRLLLSLLGIVVSVASSAALAKPLLFGVANASFQVEGSPVDSDWRRWTRTPGKIKDGTNADAAAGFWTRYEEDFRTARATGMNAFRIALAWERINPALGRWDEAALDRYAAMIASMRAHGLEPVVTLHHYVLPAWLAEKGGVLAPDYADRFAEYAVKAISRLSSVRYWMTTNEPYILAREAYIDGNYPPGHLP